MLKKDLPLSLCEIKFAQDKPTSFSGYASVFGGVDAYGDTIVRGAYADTLKARKNPILLLYGHNPSRVIGKWTDAREDEKGLFVEGELTPGHSDAGDVAASLKHGALSGLSIGYRVPPGGASEGDDGTRKLLKIELIEISVVALPADDAARVDLTSVKSQIDGITTIRELEEFLRDEGNFSNAVARAVAQRAKAIFPAESGASAAAAEEIKRLTQRVVTLEADALLAAHRIPTSLITP